MKWRSWRRWWWRRGGRGGRRNKSVMIWDARNRSWKTRLRWWYIWWRRRRQGQWGRRRRRNYPLSDLISPSSSSDHVDKRSSNLRVSRWSRGEEEEEEEASRWSQHATKTSRVKVVIYIISSQIVEEVTQQSVGVEISVVKLPRTSIKINSDQDWSKRLLLASFLRALGGHCSHTMSDFSASTRNKLSYTARFIESACK